MPPIVCLALLVGLMLPAMSHAADCPAIPSAFTIIAHRGASAYRPEHTLESYRLAIAQGADFIEPDLVPTRDGVLIVRHENALSGSTNVAALPQFADRRTRKVVDGVAVEDWFAEDFTLAEIRQLRARETRPNERPENTRFDAAFGIPTFAEVVALARAEGDRLERPIGVYPETKHPTYFLHEGSHLDGTPIALDTSAMLLEVLETEEFTDPARVYIQSFEIANLRRLRHALLPAMGLQLPLVQLLGDMSGSEGAARSGFGQPYDVIWHARRGDDPAAIYGPLAGALRLDAQTHYGQLVTPHALTALRDHADALGPWIPTVLGDDGRARPWMADARALGFGVHPYTLRTETAFLPVRDGQPVSATALLFDLQAAGATGVFADDPAHAVAVRDGQR